jgi:hypothetical protein
LLLGALFAANCLYLNALQQRYGLFGVTDFSHHGWLVGRVLLGGGDPYNAQEWLRAHWTPEYEQEIGWAYATGQIVNVFPTRPGQVYNPQHLSDFLYPLWMAVLFSPFALLPLFWALALFMLVNEIGLLVGLWCACKILRFTPPWYGGLLLVLLAFGFRPTFFTLQEGAYGGLVFGALFGAILLIQRRRAPWLVGALLAFCTIKLQVTLAVLIFVGLWLLTQRRWTTVAWTAGWGFLLWGGPTLVWPGWISEWLQMTGLVSPVIFAQPTLWSLWVSIAGDAWWIVGLAVTALLVGVLWRVWRADLAGAGWDSLPLTVILGLLLAYYAWDYDHILLLFPWLACWVKVAIGESGSARLWRYGLMIWLLLVPLYILLPLDPSYRGGYGLIVPVSLLMIYLLARRSSASILNVPRSNSQVVLG